MIKYLILFLVIIILIFIIFHQELVKIPSYQIETFDSDSCYVRSQGAMNVNMEQCNIYYTDKTNLCDSYPELYKLSEYQLTKLSRITTDPVQYNGKSGGYSKQVINSIITDKTSKKLSVCNFKPTNLYEIKKKDGDSNLYTYDAKRQYGCFLPLSGNDIVDNNISDSIISKYGANINNSCISGTNKAPITNITCVGTNCPVSNKFHVIKNFDNIQNNYSININNNQIFLKIYGKTNVAFVKYNKTTNTLVNITDLSTIINKYDTFYEIKYKNPTPNTREYPREPITNYVTKYSDNTVFQVMASSGINAFNIFNNSVNGWDTEPSRINTYINDYSGEFLKFDLGETIVVKNFDLYPNSQSPNRSPKNFRIYATNDINSYNGLTKSGVIIKDNGVDNKDPINNNNYYYYVFENTGNNNSITFLKDTACDILIVGGGGAGASGKGGGSSGGILYYTGVTMRLGTYNITVGSGGINQGANGGISKISQSNNDIAVAVGGIGATSSEGATGTGNNINNIKLGNLVINKIALAGGEPGNSYTPIRLYPPVSIGSTNNISVSNKTLSNLDYGNGNYNISWSSSYGQWDCSHLFDGVNSGGAGGHSGHNKYSNYGYSTTDNNLVQGYNGEWVILKLPYSIYLSYVKIYMRNGFATRAPYNYKIYGKNDSDNNWTEIISKENAVYSDNVHTSDTVVFNTSFNTYGLVVNKIGLNASGNMLNFDELQFYGKELNNFDYIANALKSDGTKILPRQIPQSNDFYYAFTSTTGINSITFTKNTTCDILVVGGGGAGGGRHGAGGGAGGLIYSENLNINKGIYSVIIGSGGTGANNKAGEKGNNSSVFNIIANGGGGGSSYNEISSPENINGGSGGGSTNHNPGNGIANQGNAGGTGTRSAWGYPYNWGGGGGAGNNGGDGTTNKCGDGGNGKEISITGTKIYYAGGGGGGSHDPSPLNKGGKGGLGGGGDGGIQGQNNPGKNGIDGLGGGGGGASTSSGGNSSGGKGGSGIVIIRVRATQIIIGSGGGGGIQSNGTNSIGGSPLINNITGTNIAYASGGNGFSTDSILSSQQQIGLYGNGGNSSINTFGRGGNGVVIIRWLLSPINMGNNWMKIYEHSPPIAAPTEVKNYSISNTAPYRYYVMVVNNNWINNYGCSISKLKLFGYQQSLTERRVIIPPAIYASPKNFNSDAYLFTFDSNNKISEYDTNTINFSLTKFKKDNKYITDKLLNTNNNTPVYGKISKVISEYINRNNNGINELNLSQIDAKIVEYNNDNANIGNQISNSLTNYKNAIFQDIDISGMSFDKYENYDTLSNGKFYLSNDDNIYIKL